MRAELELMHQQSALLIAHTQLERQKLKSQLERRQGLKRPASFHGDDLIGKMVETTWVKLIVFGFQTKPHLNVFLPFKLHGTRVEQQRKSQTMQNGVENGAAEEFEELEFLKFFDCARCKFCRAKSFESPMFSCSATKWDRNTDARKRETSDASAWECNCL